MSRLAAPAFSLLFLACSSPKAPVQASLERVAAQAEPEPQGSPPAPLGLLDRPLCPPSEQGAYCEGVRALERMMNHRAQASALLELAEKLTRDRPDRYEGWMLLGRAERLSEPFSFGEGGAGTTRALAAFEKAAALGDREPDARLEVARALLVLGEAARAEPFLVELSARFDRDPEVAGALGVCLLAQGHVRDARAWLERAASLDAKVAERWVAVGAVRMLEGDLDGAEAAFRAALHLEPALGKAHGDLGALLLLRARVEEGIKHLERARSLEPRNAAYLSNLAYGYYLRGDPRALELARVAVRANETLVSARLTLALILAQAGDIEEASKELDVAGSLDPSDPRVHVARSDLEELRGAPPRPPGAGHPETQ